MAIWPSSSTAAATASISRISRRPAPIATAPARHSNRHSSSPTSILSLAAATIQFSDGYLQQEDLQGANPAVAFQTGSIAAYATALADYQGEITPEAGDTEGTGGDDDLPGSRGDDAMDGGEGDDSFQSSGGSDTVDGGAGLDRLSLFGAFGDFAFTRDAETGDVTIKDRSGLEGKITIKNVEKIYFATDNEEYEPGDLVGFWGTPGNDALIEGNWRDNLIYGLAGDDLLEGHEGDDLLIGGAGADTMNGGLGDDEYYVDLAADVVDEALGEGRDVIYASATFGLSAGSHVEVLSTASLIGTDPIGLFGNELAQEVLGNAGANVIRGGGGADALLGLGGNDEYYLGDANERVLESSGQGRDAIYASVDYRARVRTAKSKCSRPFRWAARRRST